MNDKIFVGMNSEGLACYASEVLIAQVGEREVRDSLKLITRYPVKTDLSGNIVMVEGSSHEDAIARWLNRKR